MKLLSIAGLKDHTNRFFFLSLTATDDLCGLCDKPVFETNVRLNCLCWLSTEKSKNLSNFRSQSTVATRFNFAAELAMHWAASLNVTWQGKETLEVSTAAPSGHNCASRLYSHDVWWLEMFCCRQYIKHLDPGMILPGCGHVVPCYPVRNKQLPMRHFSMNSKQAETKKAKVTGDTQVARLCLSLIK